MGRSYSAEADVKGNMETYIILLRGVMPTGKNKVLMAPLRAALEASGLEEVRTYIQSGNVVARSNLRQSQLETLVHEVIEERFGGDIAVLARTASSFQDILKRNPFANVDTTKLYFTLLATEPEEQRVKAFLLGGYSPDQVTVIGDVVYVLCATQYRDETTTSSSESFE
jgi:uncharacterized protein (DUF1697 family)